MGYATTNESESPTSGTFDEQLRAMECGQRMLTRSTMVRPTSAPPPRPPRSPIAGTHTDDDRSVLERPGPEIANILYANDAS